MEDSSGDSAHRVTSVEMAVNQSLEQTRGLCHARQRGLWPAGDSHALIPRSQGRAPNRAKGAKPAAGNRAADSETSGKRVLHHPRGAAPAPAALRCKEASVPLTRVRVATAAKDRTEQAKQGGVSTCLRCTKNRVQFLTLHNPLSTAGCSPGEFPSTAAHCIAGQSSEP